MNPFRVNPFRSPDPNSPGTHPGDMVGDTAGDIELLELVRGQSALLEAAGTVRRALNATAEVDLAFRRQLHARLVADRRELIKNASATRQRPARVWWWQRPMLMAPIGFGMAAALVLGVVLRGGPPSPVAVAVAATAGGQSSVDPATPVVLAFDRPMDHDAVKSALRIQPATTVVETWQGNNLLVSATHGLVANQPYALTIDHAAARTAAGASLAQDIQVSFGTAPAVLTAPATTPVALSPHLLAPADGGATAAVASDGSVIATNAGPVGSERGLVRIVDGRTQRLGAATPTLRVSASGHSMAYVSVTSGHGSIVFANGSGSGGHAVAADVDAGSPLGWIGDSEVSFVSYGRLVAIDQSGHTRQLSAEVIDLARETVVISSGSRYVYVGAAAPASSGRVLDMQTHLAYDLRGISGQPTFSADGATVVWVDGSGSAPVLHIGPSAAGPVQTVTLPIQADEAVGGLSVSPAGNLIAYSVAHGGGGGGELRLATFPQLGTVATVPGGAAASPAWSVDGATLVMQRQIGADSSIAEVAIPRSVLASTDPTGPLLLLANGEIGGDQDALRKLVGSSVNLAGLPRPSRAGVGQLRPADSQGRYEATMWLLFGTDALHSTAREADEIVTMTLDANQRLRVTGVSASSPTTLSVGPHIRSVAPFRANGASGFTIGYDSDCDPQSVIDALQMTMPTGRVASYTTRYDTNKRLAIVTLDEPGVSTLGITIGTALKDVAGQHLTKPFTATVDVLSA